MNNELSNPVVAVCELITSPLHKAGAQPLVLRLSPGQWLALNTATFVEFLLSQRFAQRGP
jgi:hypothetical protein